MLVTRIAELRVRTVLISGSRMFSRVGSRASEHGSTFYVLPQAEWFTVHHYLVPQAMLNMAGKQLDRDKLLPRFASSK